ncbi:MAG: sulfotransferase [Gammaproteobacteria bacterium]|nr:sulfotransferase [Gammaproteobacteria bacterium]NNF61341.1 tetratricopeptide repeat protein [Gammaproteobacteria bacterium]
MTNKNDVRTAIRLHRNGRLQAAHEVYRELLDATPDNARLLSLFGQLEIQMGRFDTAIEKLQEAARLAPDDQRIALTLARGLATSSQHDEALSIVHRLLSQDDTSADAWCTLAAVHRYRSDHLNEMAALERATELAPDDIAALIARANAEAANDLLDRALQTLRTAARKAPRNARVANNLGALYLRRNNLPAATAELHRALKISPEYAIAASNLATAQHRSGHLDAARQTAERALQLAPGNADARRELASVLMAQGDLAGAESAVKAGLERQPADQGLLAALAELRDRQGRAEEGMQLIADVVASDQATPDIRLAGATLAKRIGRREAALGMLAPLLDSSGDPLFTLGRNTRRRLSFLLGEINDAGADYSRAIRYFDVANMILKPDYDIDKLYARVDEIIRVFDAARLEARDAPERRPRRVFVVGMPRSGTGLVDAMLQRHPAIHSCGELPLVAGLVNATDDFPHGFAELDDTQLERLADRYCSETAAAPDIECMTDNMPLNFFYLGAIAKMMPDALFISCVRHPADTVLSCYFQNFLDPALAFSFDLDSTGHYWRNYHRLMRHWQEHLSDMIVEIQYEEVVASAEATMQPVIEKLGLDWDAQILQPHESARYGSGSHTRIREPIHSRSIGRFARYRPFLGERAEPLQNLE